MTKISSHYELRLFQSWRNASQRNADETKSPLLNTVLVSLKKQDRCCSFRHSREFVPVFLLLNANDHKTISQLRDATISDTTKLETAVILWQHPIYRRQYCTRHSIACGLFHNYRDDTTAKHCMIISPTEQCSTVKWVTPSGCTKNTNYIWASNDAFLVQQIAPGRVNDCCSSISAIAATATAPVCDENVVSEMPNQIDSGAQRQRASFTAFLRALSRPDGLKLRLRSCSTTASVYY